MAAAQAGQSEDIFLFVNPGSGGNKGQDFLKVPQPFFADLEDGRRCELHIYSLPDNPAEGFRLLKQIADRTSSPVRCVVGGGDGTVMWADSVATQQGIDTARQMIYGIIPLGTGNDFSRVAGWGGKNPKGILDNDCRLLRDMVKWWSRASVRPHDVWQCTIEVDDDDGKIMKARGTGEVELDKKELSSPLINYFSIGQESKVGVEFDKNRTKSQTCNLFVYAWQGCAAEMSCGGRQNVTDLVANMYAGDNDEGKLVFGHEDSDVHLVGDPESLMFLNVNSYAGGAGKFWQLETEIGTEPAPAVEDVDVRTEPGDGRIEVVTLPNIANIALDKLSHAAKRVHSGGPYHLEFFSAEDGDEQHVYCEVDGEFYHLVNPTTTTIVFLKKLQVLQNNVPEDSWMKLMRKGIALPADVAKGAWSATADVTRIGFRAVQDGITSLANGTGDALTTLGTGTGHALQTVGRGLGSLVGSPSSGQTRH